MARSHLSSLPENKENFGANRYGIFPNFAASASTASHISRPPVSGEKLENPPKSWSDVVFAQHQFEQAVESAQRNGICCEKEIANNKEMSCEEAEYRRQNSAFSKELTLVTRVFYKRLYTNRILTRNTKANILNALEAGKKAAGLVREQSLIQHEAERLMSLLPHDWCVKEPDQVSIICRDILEQLEASIAYFEQLQDYNSYNKDCKSGPPVF